MARLEDREEEEQKSERKRNERECPNRKDRACMPAIGSRPQVTWAVSAWPRLLPRRSAGTAACSGPTNPGTAPDTAETSRSGPERCAWN